MQTPVGRSFVRKVVSALAILIGVSLLPRSLALPGQAAHAQSGVPAGLSAADWPSRRALLPPGQQDYIKSINTGANDHFGWSVAVEGDTMVVGAPYEDSGTSGVNSTPDEVATNAGAAYVFERSSGAWIQQAYLKASNPGGQDFFGWSVAIDGDIIVVGAYGEDSSTSGVNSTPNQGADNAGAAYVFVRNGTSWSQQAYLKASNPGQNDEFGGSVSVRGNTIVVGAVGESSAATGVNGDQSDNSMPRAGAAYVFVASGPTWAQQAYLKASNTQFHNSFGHAVAVDGDLVVVGAPQESSSTSGVNSTPDQNAGNAGAAYVFARNATSWTHQAYLKASNTERDNLFGRSVGLSGNTIVIGAPSEQSAATGVNGDQSDNSALGSGAAYVFVQSGPTWIQQAYVKASNTDPGDAFGFAVAVEGDTIAVGAPQESSASTGFNGDGGDNSMLLAGAAYTFVRSGTTWTHQDYVKATNTGWNDDFGWSVGVDKATIVVGSIWEDSMATGVNGDQGNNAATDAGAAYVMIGTATLPPDDFKFFRYLPLVTADGN